MQFDHSALIQDVQFSILDKPFTKEEIDSALKEMPSNHAPGPDVFNGFL